MSKPKVHALTLAEKIQVINLKDQGKSQRDIAERFKVGKTQICTIIKRRDEIMKLKDSNASLDSKRLKTTESYEDVNKLTYRWFLEAVRRRVEISGPIIQEKARSFAKDLNHDKFTGSNGWLHSFVKRNGIVFGNLSGEAGDVDKDVVKSWISDLPEVIKDYQPRDILNQDETALLFKTTQSKSFYKKQDKPGGAKKSKERVTISLCTNMEGGKEKMMLIGKAKRPRCFKSIDTSKLPVEYRFNKKAWMTGDLFSSFLQSLNEKMKRENRHVILFMDNAPSHKPQDLSNIKIKFLPPKTTSVLQPLDQGIIQAFKLLYRKRQYRHILTELDRTTNTGVEIMAHVNVLQAIMWAAEAWEEVDHMTIKKCFWKAGFPGDPRKATTDDSELTPQATTNDVTQTIPRVFNQMSEEFVGLDINQLATLEAEIETEDTQGINWDQDSADILRAIQDEDASGDDEEEEEAEASQPQPPPSVSDALNALQVLKDFYASKGQIDELQKVFKLDKSMFTTAQNSKMQSSLEAFGFNKVK